MFLKLLKLFNKTNKICYCTQSTSKNKIYSSTVLLPKTKFPLRLDGQKLIDRDVYIYNAGEFENLYPWQRSYLSEPEFILHDGPPYANGQPHMGHAINKILKDTILRYHILNGNKVHYIPGWDCHGLPIELKALSNSYKLNAIEIRSKARAFAKRTVKKQMQIFKSWGVIGDWKNSYTTYSTGYVKCQFRQFFKMYKNNLIYRDFKPIYWSPSSKTALAEAELEYNEKHKSPSAYVRFELKSIPKVPSLKNKSVYLIVWTTTPWSLPSNQAVCFNDSISYSLIRKYDENEIYIVATDLINSVSKELNCNFMALEHFKGSGLECATYSHPIYKDRTCPLLPSSHATSSKGTGLVHTAPAHGPDDFLVGLRNKLKIVDLVDELGCYRSETGEDLKGKFVLTDGSETVLGVLKQDLLHLGELVHSYPYDWRTNQPVIVRASQQWFIDTTSIKSRAIELLEDVNVIPNEKSDIYKRNLKNQIEKRPYWCISRQRKWGVPIPVFYDKITSETIINEDLINHHCNLLERHGTEFWWKLSLEELLPNNLYSGSLENVNKGEDIMDIWFDSGISWAKVLDGTKVADIYLEGVDQLTGWFQSSLLTSAAIRDKAPYKTIYVHGFAVDENGAKMSKSTGNVIDPVTITNGLKNNKKKPFGIDALRWWATCHANQVSLAYVSDGILQTCQDEVQKIRSVLRFALGALSDYEEAAGDFDNLLLVDRYILHLLYQYSFKVDEYVKDYQFQKINFAVTNLLTNSVSALYYMAIKDRLYCDRAGDITRRSAQFVLLKIFQIVSKTIAPILPHLAEEMYLYFPQRKAKTYFTDCHDKPETSWENKAVETAMDVILKVKKEVNKNPELTTITADVFLILSKKSLNLFKDLVSVKNLEDQLVDILQVSSIKIYENSELSDNFNVIISKSKKVSCPRCRKVCAEKEDELCKRCFNVVNDLNNKAAVVY